MVTPGEVHKETNVSTVKIAFWYVFSNFLTKGIAVISTPIFTRLMSQSEYGRFGNFTSWESIITVFATLELGSSIARAKYDFADRMEEYISSILVLSNIATFGIYCLVELNQKFFVDFFSIKINYLRILFLYLLFSPAFTYLQIKHRIYKKYKFSVFFSISSAIVRTTVSIILVVLLEDKFKGRILGYLVPITIFNLVLWLDIMFRGKKISLECMRYACAISIPLIPHVLSGIVLTSSDRIMITKYCGSQATALYSIAYSVSMLASLLWNSMNQAWSPWLYDHMSDNDKTTIWKNSKIYLGVFAVLITGILMFAPEILILLGGKKYYEARYVIPPVMMGCAFQFVYGMYVNIEIFSKKTFIISAGTMFAALLNLILNWIFIPQYGYMAAAYTTMAGYFTLLMFHYFIVKYIVKEYFDIYDTKFIFGTIGLIIAIGAVSFALFRCMIVRYAIGLFYIVFMSISLYKYRGKIKSILKS